MTIQKQIQLYQKDCFQRYKKEINYPESLSYLKGNPINVLVPIETSVNKFMIVGAYPSAKFFTLRKSDGAFETDVPLYDNDSPFSNESYFDGSRIRSIPSGKELNEVILHQIGVKREDCWVTDLVKVFLFKQGHVDRYIRLGRNDIKENRSDFKKLAQASIPWLIREIRLATPKLIILLGAEVTSVFLKTSKEKAKELMDGSIHELNLEGMPIKTICLPHPGILMKPSQKNPWPDMFREKIAPRAKEEIQNI